MNSLIAAVIVHLRYSLLHRHITGLSARILQHSNRPWSSNALNPLQNGLDTVMAFSGTNQTKGLGVFRGLVRTLPLERRHAMRSVTDDNGSTSGPGRKGVEVLKIPDLDFRGNTNP